ncbi:MAG: UDP-N-acetylmuramate:L-alanyl-gamma-D-glutamyl-meso-diaminopimelate ligase [Nitrospiria bacterium]
MQKNIHMIAICGTGMAALAGLLKKAGHAVTGSDAQVYPPMSTFLEKAEIICKSGFAPDHIEPHTDLVIIGNAVRKDNPEVLEALKRKLPTLSMAAAVEEYFLKSRQSLVVSGTHGKTTTSSILGWVLSSAGCDPSMLIGGWVQNLNSNHRLGSGPHFVIEGDEYDTAFFDKGPKFLHYRPQHAILTSIEFDHADIFADLDAVKSAFQKFVHLLPPNGTLLAGAGDQAIDKVIQNLNCRIERYGTEMDGNAQQNQIDWLADGIHVAGNLICFNVSYHQKKMGNIESPLFGRHNIKNTLAVIALCHHLGLSWEKIREGIKSFQGVKRRQEIVGIAGDIIIMDDFAHHPTAIAETLASLRWRYPTRRIWAVFEPRSATSRRNIFQEAFIEAFKKADRIILAEPFATEKLAPDERLNPLEIIKSLNRTGNKASFIPTSEKIISELPTQLQAGDLVCIMSSGGFGGIHRKLLSQIKSA